MRVLITCVVLALLASCDSKEACEERGGFWGSRCGRSVELCDGPRCYERLANAGEDCTGYVDCPDGACEASGGFGGGGFCGGAAGHCCDYEGCRPTWVVSGGCVGHGPIE